MLAGIYLKFYCTVILCKYLLNISIHKSRNESIKEMKNTYLTVSIFRDHWRNNAEMKH